METALILCVILSILFIAVPPLIIFGYITSIIFIVAFSLLLILSFYTSQTYGAGIPVLLVVIILMCIMAYITMPETKIE